MGNTSCVNCSIYQESENRFEKYAWCYVIGHYVAPTDNTGICKPIIEKIVRQQTKQMEKENIFCAKEEELSNRIDRYFITK